MHLMILILTTEKVVYGASGIFSIIFVLSEVGHMAILYFKKIEACKQIVS